MVTDLAALGHLIDGAQYSLFRLETLDRYDVESDGGDFQRYMSGEDGPGVERKAGWHKALAAYRNRGVTVSRVHVVRSPLSDYLRYEFDWGYAYNVAYEDIRILDLAHRSPPAELDGIGDFWLIDRSAVAIMRYDSDGRYLGFDTPADGDVRGYLAAAGTAWRRAVPFNDYRAGRRVA